jgi:hypothetical protein
MDAKELAIQVRGLASRRCSDDRTPCWKIAAVWVIRLAAAAVVAGVGFYLLSLVSELWILGATTATAMWALALAAVVCAGLAMMVRLTPGVMLLASVVMAVLVGVGLFLGLQSDPWSLPIPKDLASLTIYGARSPIVVGPIALCLVTGFVEVVRTRSHRNVLQTKPHRPRRKGEGQPARV